MDAEIKQRMELVETQLREIQKLLQQQRKRSGQVVWNTTMLQSAVDLQPAW